MNLACFLGSRRQSRPEVTTSARGRVRGARRTALAAMALGAWMLAWGGAAEAQEPSHAGGAPSALAAPVAPVSPLSLASSSSSFESAVLLSRSRYRDRVVRRPWRRERRDRYYDEPSGWVALRGGFFDTDHVSKNDWLVGAKVTGQVARHLRLGVSVDLQRRSDAIREQIERYEDPAGNPVEASVTRFESASNLIPILGIIEVHPATGPLRPYLGVGAGYEALIVEVDDFETGIEFDDDYGGFGWQPYAGLEMPLSRNLALNGEVFGNFATVKRTVRDLDTGARVTEEIDLDGIGFRAGLSFGF